MVSADKSYRAAAWVPSKPIRADPRRKILISQLYNSLENRDPEAVHGILPEWLRVDRVIGSQDYLGRQEYLVKFCGLPYVEATWETADSLKDDQVKVLFIEWDEVFLKSG